MKIKKLLSFAAAATMTITALAGSLSGSVIGASAVDIAIKPNRGSWKETKITNATQLKLMQNESNGKISDLDDKNDIKITINVSGIEEASAAYVIFSASGGGTSFSAWNSSDYSANTSGITNPYTEIPSDGQYTVSLHSEKAFPENTNFAFLGVGFTKNTTSTAVRSVNAELVSVKTTNSATVVSSGRCGDSATYELDSDGIMRISGTGAINASKIVFAKGISNRDVKSIEIGEGITELAENCFNDYSLTQKINLPSTLKTIGNRAFYGCELLEEIDIPDSVTSIGEYAFNANNRVLTSIKIPDGVTAIPEYAFSSCYQLRTIIIGEGVTSIGKYAFGSDERTKDVYIYSKNLESVEAFKRTFEQSEVGNVGYVPNVFASFEKENNTVFHVYKDSKTEQTLRDNYYIEKDTDVSYIDDEVEVPTTPKTPAATVDSGKCGQKVKWTLDADGVLTLSGSGNMYEEEYRYGPAPEWEFNDHKADIKKVVVGKDVTSIGRAAFKGSAVEEIVFEATVLDPHFAICQEAFADCANLRELDMSKQLIGISYGKSYAFQFIEYAAFQNCSSLETVIFPDGSAIKLGARVFKDCTSLKNVIFPQSVDFKSSSLKQEWVGTDSHLKNPVVVGGQFENCPALEGVYFFKPYEYVYWYTEDSSSIFFTDSDKESYTDEEWAKAFQYSDIFDASTNANFYFTEKAADSNAESTILKALRTTTHIDKLKAADYITSGDYTIAQSTAYSNLQSQIDYAEIYVEANKGFVDDEGKITVENRYTEESYAKYAEALETAQNVDMSPRACDFFNIRKSIPEAYTYTKSMNAIVPLKRDIDTFTDALDKSMKELKGKPCNYDRVDEAIARVPEDLSIYTDDSVFALKYTILSVPRDLTMEKDNQDQVFLWAATIDKAIEQLELKPADFKAVDEAIAKIPTDLSKYTDETVKALNDAVNAVDRNKKITEQEIVDGYAKAINDAISALKVKPAPTKQDPTKPNPTVNTPVKTTTPKATRSKEAVKKDKAAAKKAMKQAKITKLKVKSKAKKKINVTWKKVKKAKGYQVQVSTKKNFKKVIFKKDLKKTKLNIKNKKIKSKKTYYVRVRAYATYKNTNNKTVKVFSKWNKKLRKVKVK